MGETNCQLKNQLWEVIKKSFAKIGATSSND